VRIPLCARDRRKNNISRRAYTYIRDARVYGDGPFYYYFGFLLSGTVGTIEKKYDGDYYLRARSVRRTLSGFRISFPFRRGTHAVFRPLRRRIFSQTTFSAGTIDRHVSRKPNDYDRPSVG